MIQQQPSAPPPSYEDVNTEVSGYSSKATTVTCDPLVHLPPSSFNNDLNSQTSSPAVLPNAPPPPIGFYLPPSDVPLSEPLVQNTNPSENAEPPSYVEVLEAEGTGKFPVVGRRTRNILHQFQTQRSTASDESDFSEGWDYFFPRCFVFTVLAAIPVAMIVLGAVHRNDCPMDPNIPIFMMTSGSWAIAIVLFFILTADTDAENSTCTYLIGGTLIVIFTGLQIWGSIEIFRKWSRWDYVKDDPLLFTWLS